MHTKLLCYSKLLINKVLGRTQCGDEEDRCIFGESLFVPDQVAVSHLWPLSSSCPDNWSKGGRRRRRRRRRRRLADGLCLLPLKPLLRLAPLGCQAHIWYYHQTSFLLLFSVIWLSFSFHDRDLTRVATVHLPQRVPYGVHGLWLDKQFLDGQDSSQKLLEIDSWVLHTPQYWVLYQRGFRQLTSYAWCQSCEKVKA